MTTMTFDRLAYIDRLKAAGFAEPQARAMADGLDQALREEVATKTDIAAVRSDLAAVKSELAADIATVRAELKADIAAVRAELKGDIAAVRTELKADIAAVRTELKGDIAAIRTELAAVKHDMLRWIVGMAFAQTGLTVALIRFLPH